MIHYLFLFKFLNFRLVVYLETVVILNAKVVVCNAQVAPSVVDHVQKHVTVVIQRRLIHVSMHVAQNDL